MSITEKIISAAPERQSTATAEPRSMAYAIFSRLLASPFEQTEEALEFFLSGEMADVLNELAAELPYQVNLAPLVEELKKLTPEDEARIRREYSSQFEVGSDGPAIALRAELVRSKDQKLKEELVRFYDFFSYELSEKFAWAPDHISILLEFMQLLCLKEASAETEKEAQSLARAQNDFIDRHIISWLPVSIGKTVQRSPDEFYTKVLTTVWELLEQDRAWSLSNTVAATEGEG